MTAFNGSITTTGKSEAIRLDKALFRLHPEFKQKAKVTAHVIGPGQALITVVDDGTPVVEEEDPVVLAFVAFLEKDMKKHPARVKPLSRKLLSEVARLTKNVKVSDDERLPDDFFP